MQRVLTGNFSASSNSFNYHRYKYTLSLPDYLPRMSDLNEMQLA
jgi:hypothetical protein